jgi:hypothetical protein
MIAFGLHTERKGIASNTKKSVTKRAGSSIDEVHDAPQQLLALLHAIGESSARMSHAECERPSLQLAPAAMPRAHTGREARLFAYRPCGVDARTGGTENETARHAAGASARGA